MEKTTTRGEGVVTRVSGNGGKYINVRIKTSDRKLTLDVKFALEDWATASTSLVSPCTIDIHKKGDGV